MGRLFKEAIMATGGEATSETDAGWRFKAGIGIFVFAFSLYLLIPLAAALGVPSNRIAALTGALLITNKVLLLVCVAVMGKAGFQKLKTMVFSRFKPAETVGPVRHAIGLVMFCLPLLTATMEPYLDHFMPGLRPNIWQLQLLGDAMLIASFFVLGGDFWSKFGALFKRTVRAET
jgi:hypothetical protein